MIEKLRALAFEAEYVPWRPEPPHEDEPRDVASMWLTNAAGDSLLLDANDVSLMVNALPKLLAVIEAAKAWAKSPPTGPLTGEDDDLLAALAALDDQQDGEGAGE